MARLSKVIQFASLMSEIGHLPPDAPNVIADLQREKRKPKVDRSKAKAARKARKKNRK